MMTLRFAGMKYMPKRFVSCSAADRRASALRALAQLGPHDFEDLQLDSPEFAEFVDALNRAKELVSKRRLELYAAETEHPHDYAMLLKQ